LPDQAQGSNISAAELDARIKQLTEAGFGDWSEDLLYVMQRLRNPGTVGEGSSVVPRLTGSVRVPYPNGFRVASEVSFLGGTSFTLAWIDPEDVGQIDSYNIYAKNLLEANKNPTYVGSSASSPVAIRITASVAAPVVFFIQTVLKNGYVNDLSLAPSCVGQCIAPSVTTADYPPGTPGAIFHWNATGAAAELVPGVTGTILSANGTGAVDTYKTNEQLYLSRYVQAPKAADFNVDNSADVYIVDTLVLSTLNYQLLRRE
jgi:hypothetical protein